MTRLVLAVTGAALVVIELVARGESYAVAAELTVARYSGILAMALLIATLVVGAAARHCRLAGLLAGWRRALGLASALAASWHAAGVWGSPWWPELLTAIVEPQLRSGAAALLAVLALAATSFPQWLRVPRWKTLHFAIYPAALLAAHHVLLSSMASPAWVEAALTAVAVLALWRLLPRRGSSDSPRPAPPDDGTARR